MYFTFFGSFFCKCRWRHGLMTLRNVEIKNVNDTFLRTPQKRGTFFATENVEWRPITQFWRHSNHASKQRGTLQHQVQAVCAHRTGWFVYSVTWNGLCIHFCQHVHPIQTSCGESLAAARICEEYLLPNIKIFRWSCDRQGISQWGITLEEILRYQEVYQQSNYPHLRVVIRTRWLTSIGSDKENNALQHQENSVQARTTGGQSSF